MVDPVGFVLVHVASRTGRHVLVVAGDAFALTLWTYFHLRQGDHVEALQETDARFDLAALIARAYHRPSEVQELHRQFREKVKGQGVTRDEIVQRAQKHVEAHLTMRKLDEPV